MNKLRFVMSIFVFLFFSTVTFTGTASADLMDGLAAYYPFNGNANDESGNGNPGIVYGATLTTDRFGNADSAYRFGGVYTDYIYVNDSPSLHFSSAASFSVWINTPSTNISQCVLTKDYINGGANFHLRAGTDRLQFSVGYDGGFPGQAIELNVLNSPVNPNQWHHIAGTYDGSQLNLYVDSILVGTEYYSGGFSTDNGRPLMIGQKNYRPGTPLNNVCAFEGIIDDVRIYNRALSESEIQELYQPAQSVPEPSTIVLLVSGLAGLAGLGRKFKVRS